MEEGREKVAAEGDVTRIAEGGSRTSQMEDEFFSADVDDRRVIGETQQLLGVSAHGRQWRCLQETKRKENSHQYTRKSVGIRKGREWRKQF